MRRAAASTLLRSLQLGGSPSTACSRLYSTQQPITATLFPGDGAMVLGRAAKTMRGQPALPPAAPAAAQLLALTSPPRFASDRHRS